MVEQKQTFTEQELVAQGYDPETYYSAGNRNNEPASEEKEGLTMADVEKIGQEVVARAGVRVVVDKFGVVMTEADHREALGGAREPFKQEKTTTSV